MDKKDDTQRAGLAESPEISEAAESSLQHDIPRSAQHDNAADPSNPVKHLLPRSPTPTMKTDSVDTDSASISGTGTPSPAPSSASPPVVHACPLPPESGALLQQSQVALKMLVSNSASGLIIGRSGSTISALQAKSFTRIKLSQGGSYYPGTSDRVCLIQGSLSNVSIAVEMVLAKLYELQSFQQLSAAGPPGTKPETVPDENATTSFIVRLLVPSTCCGMIIGRGGSNIKSLKENSEVTYIQLSPKEHEVMIGGSTLSTSERIMTITGPNFSSCVKCVRIIVNDMAQNPEISRYINMTTSYSKNLAASSYLFLEHEPFQVGRIMGSPSRYGAPEQFGQGQFSSSPPGPAPMPGMQGPPESSIPLLGPQHLGVHQGSPPSYESVSRGDPYQLVVDPTMIQSQPYGMPPSRVPDTGAPTSSSFPQYQPSQVSQPMQFWPPDSSPGSPGRNMMSTGSGNLSSVDQLSQSFQTQASLQSHPSHSSLPNLAGSQPPVTAQLGVPDARIGSILGRGGKTLTEIQALSRTKIRISQRGDFFPGTTNRVVYITGNTTQDVDHAQHLLTQRLTAGFSRSSSSSELKDS